MTRASRLITIVMIVAAVLRLWGIGFGFPGANARPDEIQIAGPAVGYLTGDLRPPFFQWPPLFQYMTTVAYIVYAVVGRPVTGLASIAAFAESRRQSLVPFLLIPRLLSALCGVVTVWLVYRIGRRLFDDRVGIVAALFLAVSFLHVRDSHFGVSDVPMTMLLTAAVLMTLHWQERGGARLALLAGVITGLAGATKYNALGAAVAFAVAWLFEAATAFRRRDGRVPSLMVQLAAYAFGAALAFLGASPYIVIDWSRFLKDIGEVQSTLANGPAGLQVGRGWWYFARVVLPAAVGWPMLLLAVGGAVGMLASHGRRAATLLAFPIAYYAFAGSGYGVFARHALPLIPFLCVTAAWATVRLAGSIAQTSTSRFGTGTGTLTDIDTAIDAATDTNSNGVRSSGLVTRSARSSYTMVALALIVGTFPAWTSIQLDRLLATTDNRIVATRVLLTTIPPGSTFGQTGESYGHAPLSIDGRHIEVRLVVFDKTAGQFAPGAPEWVLVQRSPLVYYSAVPASFEATLRDDYMLQQVFSTGAGDGDGRIYDQQDAFYLPLAGFRGIERPGPSFELYRKKP